MKDVITYVGIDAHKKDLFIAMLIGAGQTPVTWTVPNEPKAVSRLSGSSSARRQATCGAVTKQGPAGMRCSGR